MFPLNDHNVVFNLSLLQVHCSLQQSTWALTAKDQFSPRVVDWTRRCFLFVLALWITVLERGWDWRTAFTSLGVHCNGTAIPERRVQWSHFCRALVGKKLRTGKVNGTGYIWKSVYSRSSSLLWPGHYLNDSVWSANVLPFAHASRRLARKGDFFGAQLHIQDGHRLFCPACADISGQLSQAGWAEVRAKRLTALPFGTKTLQWLPK